MSREHHTVKSKKQFYLNINCKQSWKCSLKREAELHAYACDPNPQNRLRRENGLGLKASLGYKMSHRLA